MVDAFLGAVLSGSGETLILNAQTASNSGALQSFPLGKDENSVLERAALRLNKFASECGCWGQ